MKKGYKNLLTICLTLMTLLTLNIILNVLNIYSYIPFLLVVFLGLIFIIGFEKDGQIYKKDIIIMIIITCLFYHVITYATGLFIGFLKNSYNLSLIAILKNMIPIILIIVLEELIRYNLVKKGSRNRSILILTVIILVLMDINLIIKSFDFADGYLMLKFVFVYLLPSIAKNIFLTYLVYKGGYIPSIIYRFIMELPMYFMPLFPSLGNYVESSFKIILPAILIFITYKLTKSRETVKNYNPKFNKAVVTLIILFIATMVSLNSGWFKYYSLTIGSNSMKPNINMGDVIIVQKLNKEEIKKLKSGEILVFKRDNKILVHRIVNIKIVNNSYHFYTKGDANDGLDNFITEEKNVLGKTENKLRYIGYPTVLLKQLLDKNN